MKIVVSFFCKKLKTLYIKHHYKKTLHYNITCTVKSGKMAKQPKMAYKGLIHIYI